ncbi:UDP-glucuronosyl/UDP-glucosyltransferase [Cinara cedri]|uniref:UDP-glucuronosyl/UDP-glucosyltransferase n=1 Tax=Cinara cedri TaxID=506608 RepID=A0A5E4MUH6_9HEMI|nr:UDP-glucuronosyl/UDP-glucosyltransferase [Cinara cedri]
MPNKKSRFLPVFSVRIYERDLKQSAILQFNIQSVSGLFDILTCNSNIRSAMNRAFWCLLLAVTSGRPDCGDAAQILALMPLAAKSHWNVVDAVLQTLVAGGHNVTAVTPFPKKKSIANYTEVDVSRLVPSGVSVSWDKVMGECSVANNLPYLSGRHRLMCKTVYEHDEFWRAVDSNKYDLFITELLASSCDAYISYYLKVPRIVIASSHVHTWYHHTFGSHMNPAHVSTYHAPFAVPGNFVQRMANAYDYLYSHVVFRWVDREATAIGRKYFGADAPDADTLMRDTSLVFVNGHRTVDLAKPLLPNFVDIGGIHLTRPEPLPRDIEQFIDGSPNGVIYFTFGSTMKMETAPERLQNAFVEALREIPQRVLWKYENPNLSNLPKNVLVNKWFPQRSILEHKNVKLFISHGGMSGIYEAIDSGVPILGIPLFFDQFHNIANIVHWGSGVMLDHETLTKDILVNAIREMIANYDKYKLNAMELSKRFQDRPKTPKEEVLYWTEYVIKHKGAPHLKSAALNLSWYQYLLIDVLMTTVSILLICSCVIFMTIRYLAKQICSPSKSKKKLN